MQEGCLATAHAASLVAFINRLGSGLHENPVGNHTQIALGVLPEHSAHDDLLEVVEAVPALHETYGGLGAVVASQRRFLARALISTRSTEFSRQQIPTVT